MADDHPDTIQPPLTSPLLVLPIRFCSSWKIVCAIARVASSQTADVAALCAVLRWRGIDHETIDAMLAAVRWANAVLNPEDGGTAESGGVVLQAVGDRDDVELAMEVAAAGQHAESIVQVRAV